MIKINFSSEKLFILDNLDLGIRRVGPGSLKKIRLFSFLEFKIFCFMVIFQANGDKWQRKQVLMIRSVWRQSIFALSLYLLITASEPNDWTLEVYKKASLTQRSPSLIKIYCKHNNMVYIFDDMLLKQEILRIAKYKSKELAFFYTEWSAPWSLFWI